MKTKFTFSPALAGIFSLVAGLNFRVRNEDGIVSVKPTTRPYPVLAEFGFAKTDAIDTGARIALVEGELPAGSYRLEAGKYGWQRLVASDVADLTLSHVAE